MQVKLWKRFNDLFNCLPFAAVVSQKIFCVHGGLSPSLCHTLDHDLVSGSPSSRLECVRRITRPTEVPDEGLLTDLLWSDPMPDEEGQSGWGENDCGCSYFFGADVVTRFLDRTGLDLIVRGHRIVDSGFELGANGQLVTICSCSRYGGELDNQAAVMSIDADFTSKFTTDDGRSQATSFKRFG